MGNSILVVMPAYNAAKTIGNAIESIINQSYTNWTLVIVDDASTDKTVEVAKKYLSDPRIVLYTNSENMGAYYSRNAGLYLHRKEQWDFFTTHDADDISYSDRFNKLVAAMHRYPNVNGIHDMFRRIAEGSGEVLGQSLTIAHAIFRKRVLEDIGYFEEVRFGADWEYWARLNAFNSNKVKRFKTLAHKNLGGDSYIGKTNLTKIVPLGSPQRKQYIKDVQIWHRDMQANNNFYLPFRMKNSITSEVVYHGTKKQIVAQGTPEVDISNLEGYVKSDVAVVLLTWKRIPSFPKTLDMLYKQTNKNFDVIVSNGALNKKEFIQRYINYYVKRGMHINYRHDGNDEGSFRRISVGKELAEMGYKIILFIDDDITFSVKYIEKMISQYEPKTYKSAFAWVFNRNGENYYKYRTRVYTPGQKVHYCGTGVSIMDASLFLAKGIEKCPEQGKPIEDLWMSYFADHKLKWKLEYADPGKIVIGGADNVALYKEVLADSYTKADFLKDLRAKGWNLKT